MTVKELETRKVITVSGIPPYNTWHKHLLCQKDVKCGYYVEIRDFDEHIFIGVVTEIYDTIFDVPDIQKMLKNVYHDSVEELAANIDDCESRIVAIHDKDTYESQQRILAEQKLIGTGRVEITKALTKAIECHVNPNNDTRIYTAKEVTFDYATGHSVRVDFMRFKPLNNSVSGIEKGDFYCYEIKSSVEDFHSKNGHNFIGDYNYYVMPEDVYEKVSKEIPWGIGVFTSSMKERKGFVDLTQVKNAKRRDRERSVAEMLLMMFRSAARDVHKK